MLIAPQKYRNNKYFKNIIDDSINFSSLTINELYECISCCEYFKFYSYKLLDEFFWKTRHNDIYYSVNKTYMINIKDNLIKKYSYHIHKKYDYHYAELYKDITFRNVCKYGMIRSLIFLHKTRLIYIKENFYCYDIASRYGSINIIKYLIENNFSLSDEEKIKVINNAIIYGHTNLAEYLIDIYNIKHEELSRVGNNDNFTNI